MEAIPKQMTTLIKRNEEEGYECIQIPVPEPIGDEVLIKVTQAAICGSDINLYKWNDVAKFIAALPFTPGHEAAGMVVKKGPNVKDLNIGDRIAVENHFYCGECFQCKEGRGDICNIMNQYGHGKGTVHGGCSEYSIVPERFCYKLRLNISDMEAVLLEPMGVAHNSIEQLQVAGERVVVIGCGPVGLLAVGCAKAMGATEVIAVDILDTRLEMSKMLGADYVVNSIIRGSDAVKDEVMKITGGVGVGRICEASGATSMFNGCFKYLRKGGRVSVLGIPKQPFHIENPMQDILFKSLTLTTVHGRRIFHTWIECEKLIAEKKVNPQLVVSHEIPMSKYAEAFQALFSGTAGKIVMDPQC
uniref:L-threonine 3-dehydrogenase-like n=1 Tax=Ciona intestinalis TaxID=7719 RepID=F6TKR9_CIOIN|nr:uncharacterized protein LOC100180278 [Ciona intestinalis]|eukprot:XP_018669010.1 uncharacterized protein LOC100180278 [Ciona intestinalis]